MPLLTVDFLKDERKTMTRITHNYHLKIRDEKKFERRRLGMGVSRKALQDRGGWDEEVATKPKGSQYENDCRYPGNITIRGWGIPFSKNL